MLSTAAGSVNAPRGIHPTASRILDARRCYTNFEDLLADAERALGPR